MLLLHAQSRISLEYPELYAVAEQEGASFQQQLKNCDNRYFPVKNEQA